MADRGAPSVDQFVGRASELDQIEAACAAAAQGLGSVVVVSGEPGIGKSRLCAEVVVRARASGLTTVTARCWVDGGAPALWPWQPILRDLCGDDAAELLAGEAELVTVDPDRFARFAAITDRLVEVTARTPVCLVVDDVHAADAGTLLLLRFVARSLSRLRLALILSRRCEPCAEPTPERLETRLLNDIEAEATPIVLRRLDDAESSSLLDAHGVAGIEPDLRQALLRVAGGNPLHLRRIAALGLPLADHALPDGIHAAIKWALLGLAPHRRQVLRASAVLGLTPSVAEAAVVSGTDPAAVLDAVAAAAAVGLVTAGATDRFTFGHELVRAALESGLVGSDRLEAHARAAFAVAGDGPSTAPDRLARRAHHALAAAPRSVDDAHLAVAACRAAARSMVASFAYEQADALLVPAVEIYDRPGLGPAPGPLLVEWAQAALLCGRLAEARVRFDRAATAAEHEDDPVTFAEAALGLGGHWLNEHRSPVERARVLGLQRSALARLPRLAKATDAVSETLDTDTVLGDRVAALRARLEARLAAEAVYDGRPIEPVWAALEAARQCGDQAALAEALSLGHHALLAPEYAHDRLPLADELVRVASEAGHGVLALMGLCWRAVDLFLLADERAPRALEDLRQRADTLACQNILYIVDVIDVMLLARAGRLDDAEAAAGRSFELGTAVGELDALAYLGAHLLAIRWIQGRDTELLDTALEVAASPTLVQAEFAFRATAAAIAAREGRHDTIRALLEALTDAGGVAALPRSSTWLVGMSALVQVAELLGDPTLAGEVYELLLPFADRPVMPSLAVVCLGSTEGPLGTAAGTFGDLDRAVGHHERALIANRRLGNRPLVAIAQAELGTMLLRRARPDDQPRAVRLLQQAVDEAYDMGMTRRATAWRHTLAAVIPEPATSVGAAAREDVDESDGRDGRDGTTTGREGQAGPRRSGVLRRVGNGWLVAVDDRRAFVTDRVGMRYLARLLQHPGRAITALALAGAAPLIDDPSSHELLDRTARAAYLQRISELGVELAEAEAHADIERIARSRAELDALVDQVETATGLHGRPRTFVTKTERARTAVRKALKRVVDEIDAADPVVGHLLRSAITTGTTCVYTPDPVAPVTWSIADIGPG